MEQVHNEEQAAEKDQASEVPTEEWDTSTPPLASDDALPKPEEIGEYLAHQRIRRGFEIDTISGMTKISVTNLQAIEAQQYDLLPASTFTRGLITIYGNALGLPGKQLGAIFLKGCQNDGLLQNKIDNQNRQTFPVPKSLAEPARLSPATAAFIVLVITALIGLGIGFYYSWNPLSSLFEETAPTLESPAISEEAPPSTSAPFPTNEEEAPISLLQSELVTPAPITLSDDMPDEAIASESQGSDSPPVNAPDE